MGTRLYVVLRAHAMCRRARKRIIIRLAYACALGLLHAAVVLCYSSIKTREPSPLTELHCSALLQISRVAIKHKIAFMPACLVICSIPALHKFSPIYYTIE